MSRAPRRRNGRWGATAGVLGSSVLFGCAHLVNTAAPVSYLVMTFLLGVTLALWALADGALWRACAFHTVWKGLPSLFSPDSGTSAGGLSPAPTAMSFVVLLLVIGAAFWSYRRSRRTGPATTTPVTAPRGPVGG